MDPTNQKTVSENVIINIVDALDDGGRREFNEGLGKRLHYLSMGYPDARTSLIRYVLDWAVDVVLLGQDLSLGTQIAESDARIASGDPVIGPSMTSQQLRDLVMG